MTKPAPHIQLARRADTPIESGEFDSLGVVFEHLTGIHALFAARVAPQSYEVVEQRKWGFLARDLLHEVMDRQMRFIASLHYVDSQPPSPNPHLKTVALRYIAHPATGQVDVALIGKVFATTADEARDLARAWCAEIIALFPYDYELIPATSAEEFAALSGQSLIKRMSSPRQLVEVRRYEAFVPKTSETDVTEGDYLLFPFIWHPNAMEQVWRAMALLPVPILLNVTLRPTCLYEVEEIHLRQLYTAAKKLEDAEHPDLQIQGRTAAKLYADCLTRLSHPFLMRIQATAEGPMPMALAQALGTSLVHGFLTGIEGECEIPTPGYETLFPTQDELSTAQDNLRLLEMDNWGYDLAAPPYRRFRYLVDTTGAHCAFRLPFPPRGGLPGVTFPISLT